jgi:pyridinium-3,5-biscarboxylic acid mononucleotide sulfurtransferase
MAKLGTDTSTAMNGISKVVRDKYDKLVGAIRQHRSVVVAFSGGVDSTFLAWACKEALGDKVLLVTAISETYPSFERVEAEDLAKNLGIRQQTIHTGELDNPHYSENPPDRCYFCKSELFRSVLDLAKKEGFEAVFEGGNMDDLSDYRPGRRALKELKISSPLCDAGLTKAEIRELSAAVGLPTATKPSYACLASRFPYGEHLDAEKLRRVETAESAIRRMGFTQFRVRSHGNLARVELLPSEMDKGWAARDAILAACRTAGYIFVTIDLLGYRTGAMNEGLAESR